MGPHLRNRVVLAVVTVSSVLLLLKRCFTSTEAVGLLGTGALDVHLDFHTAPELCGPERRVELFTGTQPSAADLLNSMTE